MLLIRDIFTAKPGQAGKLAKLFRSIATEFGWKNVRVMTDFVADMHTVVLQSEHENLSAFEAEMKNYMTDAKLHERMAGYNDMYYSGKREMWQITE